MRAPWHTNWWNRWRYTLWSWFYDPVVRPFQRWRARSWELGAVQPGESVLLVGAGTGLDLELAPAGCRLTAIDLTPAMLAGLRQKAESSGREVDVRVMDAQRLEFASETFDVVVLHLILAVVPDPVACIQEARRVLRPDGRMLIFDKFLPLHARPGLVLRLFDLVAGVIATDVLRRLEPLLEAGRLRPELDERMGPGGFYRVCVARPL